MTTLMHDNSKIQEVRQRTSDALLEMWLALSELRTFQMPGIVDYTDVDEQLHALLLQHPTLQDRLVQLAVSAPKGLLPRTTSK